MPYKKSEINGAVIACKIAFGIAKGVYNIAKEIRAKKKVTEMSDTYGSVGVNHTQVYNISKDKIWKTYCKECKIRTHFELDGFDDHYSYYLCTICRKNLIARIKKHFGPEQENVKIVNDPESNSWISACHTCRRRTTFKLIGRNDYLSIYKCPECNIWQIWKHRKNYLNRWMEDTKDMTPKPDIGIIFDPDFKGFKKNNP